MSVLDRSALTESPLADLHAIASELSIDGYRRLRRPELIDAILAKQSGTEVEAAAGEEAPDEEPVAEKAPASPRSRSRRPRKSEAAETSDADASASADDADKAEKPEKADEADKTDKAEDTSEDDEAAGAPRRRGRRGGRGRGSAAKAESEAGSDSDAGDEEKPTRGSRRSRAAAEPTADASADDRETPEESDQLVEGVVELLANGSGFVRVDPPDPSDDDVYISSAQVKRCELVSGDRIAGPKRAPRRSERFASLIRIETINDRPASELADSLRFDDLPAARPSERIKVGSEDPTLKAIEWLTPFGKGSRVAIIGASRSGKSEALRRLAAALVGRDELTLSVALAGVRPEEISEWAQGPVVPAAAVSFAASEESQNSAIEPVIDQARRLAARGTDAVVLIDTLDGVSPLMARKAMASARNIVDGGSVTVIATASEPIGGETTVISLDVALASTGRFPALDLLASGTVRPELLVGDAGAEAIARTRAEVSEPDDED
jgi:transcription termination factor Rho